MCGLDWTNSRSRPGPRSANWPLMYTLEGKISKICVNIWPMFHDLCTHSYWSITFNTWICTLEEYTLEHVMVANRTDRIVNLLRSLFMSMNGDSHRSWELNSSMHQCTCWIPRRLKESTSVLHVRHVSFLSALLKSHWVCAGYLLMCDSRHLYQSMWLPWRLVLWLTASIWCFIDPWWSLWHLLWALNLLTSSLVCQIFFCFLFSFLTLILFHFFSVTTFWFFYLSNITGARSITYCCFACVCCLIKAVVMFSSYNSIESMILLSFKWFTFLDLCIDLYPKRIEVCSLYTFLQYFFSMYFMTCWRSVENYLYWHFFFF